MRKFNIIPAIDIMGGQCVRLTKGDYAQSKTYFNDPLEVARMFEDMGVQRLHLVDLDGAKASCPQNLSVLERIAGHTSLKVDFGGGIKSAESLAAVLESGAAWAGCSSIAVTAPDTLHEWCAAHPGRIILGADLRDGFVATHGWLKASQIGVESLLDSFPEIENVICTDISRDGMLQGIDIRFYKDLQEKYPERGVIASGGVASVEDIAAARKAGLGGIIVGKAIYEGRISLGQISDMIKEG